MAAQDRRTNMSNSTVNQQPAKGGAGGAYTWGSALDVQDFAPVGVTGGVGVMMAPAPVMAAPVVLGGTASFQMNQQAFPTLGSGQQFMATATGPVPWGAGYGAQSYGASAAPTVVTQVAQPQVVMGPQPTVIDWSKAGLSPTVMQSIVQAPVFTSQSSQFTSQSVPLDSLRARNVGAAAQFASQNAQLSNSQGLANCRPQLQQNKVIQQPQQRR